MRYLLGFSKDVVTVNPQWTAIGNVLAQHFQIALLSDGPFRKKEQEKLRSIFQKDEAAPLLFTQNPHFSNADLIQNIARDLKLPVLQVAFCSGNAKDIHAARQKGINHVVLYNQDDAASVSELVYQCYRTIIDDPFFNNYGYSGFFSSSYADNNQKRSGIMQLRAARNLAELTEIALLLDKVNGNLLNPRVKSLYKTLYNDLRVLNQAIGHLDHRLSPHAPQ